MTSSNRASGEKGAQGSSRLGGDDGGDDAALLACQ